jgi:hypothetical protein
VGDAAQSILAQAPSVSDLEQNFWAKLGPHPDRHCRIKTWKPEYYMKIYLAAMYSRREEMEREANRLKHQGFEITSRWVYFSENSRSLLDVALMDIEDVNKADAVVSFTQPESSLFHGGGRHVEFGYGLAKGKRCILIGGRENIFHHHPKVEAYPTLDAWLEKELEPA